MASELASRECVPCRGGVSRLTGEQTAELLEMLGNGWRIVNEHHLEKGYLFKNFAEALTFTNKVGAVAEQQDHHPDILTAWGKTKVTVWTHKIDGLTESDFVFAAKVEDASRA